MAKLVQVMKHGKPKVPLFLQKNVGKLGTAIQPPVLSSIGAGPVKPSQAKPKSSAPIKISPLAPVRAPGSPVVLPALVKSRQAGLLAVNQEKAIDVRQGVKAGGTAKTAVFRREIRSAKFHGIAKKSPLARKNPAPPTTSFSHGRRVITSAFQNATFHTPFQKNVNLRRSAFVY